MLSLILAVALTTQTPSDRIRTRVTPKPHQTQTQREKERDARLRQGFGMAHRGKMRPIDPRRRPMIAKIRPTREYYKLRLSPSEAVYFMQTHPWLWR